MSYENLIKSLNPDAIVNPVNQVKPLVERETYGFVNTRGVLDAFANAGWTPVSETYGRVINPERMGFQKHLIRLENPAFQAIEGLSNENNSKPQLVVLNSHDGTSSLQILWGLIRIACLNGIIAGMGINGVRLVHSKGIVERLPNGIQYMLDNFVTFANQVKTLQGLKLSDAAQRQLVETLWKARLANVENVTSVDYSMPAPKRFQDAGTDAYTLFNRVQETLMRGGIRYQYRKDIKDDAGNVTGSKVIDTTTRRIASVNSQVKLNQLAYDTTVSLAA